MKQTINSLIRYRAIDRCLGEKGKATVDELLRWCQDATGEEDITADLVKSDIQQMILPPDEGYGAPIAFDESKGLYYYHKTGFTLAKLPLNVKENQALSLALRLLTQLKDHKSLVSLRAIIQKITDTLLIQDLRGRRPSFDFVQVEESRSYGGSQFLHPIIKSILEKKVIRLYYHPFYEDKPYFTLVHPYLLKEYKNRWYLIGLNDTKKEIRTYALDRIWEFHNAEEEYIPRSFKPADYFRNTIGVISPMGVPPDIRVRVSRHQAQYLITQPLHESQFIEDEDEDNIIFGFKLHPTYEFKSYILSLGSEARILSPDSLVREMLRELNDAILEYGK